ncbi:hypothetical protein LCGC14_1016230 [marine sediment metagenome]|uniref:Uncharacterized protein n=1 Tax=marine sediment metagenome TaxID=412755 RepID=A0A0F9QGY6_9ZZZZ
MYYKARWDTVRGPEGRTVKAWRELMLYGSILRGPGDDGSLYWLRSAWHGIIAYIPVGMV